MGPMAMGLDFGLMDLRFKTYFGLRAFGDLLKASG